MSLQNFDTPRKEREEDTNFLAGGMVSPTVLIQRAQRNEDIEKNNEAIMRIENKSNEKEVPQIVSRSQK